MQEEDVTAEVHAVAYTPSLTRPPVEERDAQRLQLVPLRHTYCSWEGGSIPVDDPTLAAARYCRLS